MRNVKVYPGGEAMMSLLLDNEPVDREQAPPAKPGDTLIGYGKYCSGRDLMVDLGPDYKQAGIIKDAGNIESGAINLVVKRGSRINPDETGLIEVEEDNDFEFNSIGVGQEQVFKVKQVQKAGYLGVIGVGEVKAFMPRSHSDNPRRVLKAGATVDVEVIERQSNTRSFVVSQKALERTAIDEIVGTVQTMTVENVNPNIGVFFSIGKLSGLLHKSKLAGRTYQKGDQEEIVVASWSDKAKGFRLTLPAHMRIKRSKRNKK